MSTDVRRLARTRGFTLAEVLAALLLMAILIPVTMQAVSVASRAGMLGQRKTAAMRIAERVLDEQIVSGLIGTSATPYGTLLEGDVAYPWTITLEPWLEDPATGLQVVSVRVEFDVQGSTFDVVASTLYDPAAGATASTTSTAVAAAIP